MLISYGKVNLTKQYPVVSIGTGKSNENEYEENWLTAGTLNSAVTSESSIFEGRRAVASISSSKDLSRRSP